MTFKPSGIRVSSVVGRVMGAAEDRFNDGVWRIRIAVNHGYKDKNSGEWKETSTTKLSYSAVGEYAEPLKAFGTGDLVEVSDAALETREYETKDGAKGFDVSLRYGTIELLEAKGDRPATSGGNGFTPPNSGGGF